MRLCKIHLCELKHWSNRWVCPKCYGIRRRKKYIERESIRQRIKVKSAIWRASHKEHTYKYRTIYSKALKEATFKNYSKSEIIKCTHCGLSGDLDKLSLDHIDNNGHAFRKATGLSGNKLYSWLKSHNFPPGYQVLCHNCNILKRNSRYNKPSKASTVIRQIKIKTQVMTHYGDGKSACVKCGYNNLEALTLDHINNDGHASKIKSGTFFYSRLIKSGLPSGLQTLCFNCNMKKEIQLRR
jgi:hypothetical protein